MSIATVHSAAMWCGNVASYKLLGRSMSVPSVSEFLSSWPAPLCLLIARWWLLSLSWHAFALVKP